MTSFISTKDQYRYWAKTLLGHKVAVAVDQPQSGFYRCRLVRNGPWVPVAIWKTGETTKVQVNGRSSNAYGVDYDPRQIWNWACTHPITEEEYRHRIKFGEWAEKHARTEPAADPYRKVDPNTAPPVF